MRPYPYAVRRSVPAPPLGDFSLPEELEATVAWLRQEKEVAEDATRGLQQELDAERASMEMAYRSSIVGVTCSPSGSMALPSAYSSVARG
jgi:hypothetical protein